MKFLTITAAAMAILALWVSGVRWFYRVRTSKPQKLRTRCADSWELVVYHRPAAAPRFLEPVLLCHGLAANRYNFDFEPPYSLAHALAEAGFDCYTVEWRGTGGSRKPPRGRCGAKYCADDHIALDAPALIACATENRKSPQAFWVGHSLGGLIGLVVAVGSRSSSLRGLVTLGAPAFFQGDPFLKHAISIGAAAAWPFWFRQKLFSIAVAPFLGRIVLPLSDVIVNPRHIPPRIQRQVYAYLISSVSRRLLLQFKDWVVHDAFRSFDRTIDYRDTLDRIQIPTLVIGGSRDRLAPPDCVRRSFGCLASEDKELKLFGCEHGHRQDYGHGDLLFGEGAPIEVYPLVIEWLAARATPIRRE